MYSRAVTLCAAALVAVSAAVAADDKPAPEKPKEEPRLSPEETQRRMREIFGMIEGKPPFRETPPPAEKPENIQPIPAKSNHF